MFRQKPIRHYPLGLYSIYTWNSLTTDITKSKSTKTKKNLDNSIVNWSKVLRIRERLPSLFIMITWESEELVILFFINKKNSAVILFDVIGTNFIPKEWRYKTVHIYRVFQWAVTEIFSNFFGYSIIECSCRGVSRLSPDRSSVHI